MADGMIPGIAQLIRYSLGASCVLLVCCNLASAQAPGCAQEREVGARALDEITWKQLNAVYEKVTEKNYSDADADLQKMLGRSGRDGYLRAIIYQAMAQLEWAREDFDLALSNFEKAVELDALPNQAHFSLMYQIAQLYFMKERYSDALQRLDLWFCTAPKAKITSAAYVLKASIYARLEDYRQTLPAIEAAIAMESEPKEPWYQLKLASHYQLEQYPQAAETLEIMITHWPGKKSYWIQLAQTYYNLKHEDRALAVAALAYRKGLLNTETDLLYLSGLYSNADVPYKAAEVLQKGVEEGVVKATERHWTVIADTWYAAEEMEKALAAYERAGAAASSGDLDLRRAHILIDMEDWLRARDALNDAISKGGLDERKTGEAYLLRGMAEFNLGSFDQAGSDWEHASGYHHTQSAAQQWLNHLREERKRRAS